ncbi:putative amidohydrolase [Breoghania corrubedonensis]|uniref:Putative amidohydrolase n=1 Tax=Breoghania corrubedonensis TaxID=665038 RepID=A0A2T5UP77_9HYPH|nr:carbon-nitrogen hydrolase family protein [Breoghania corrubedonensis]PTW53221.1 putative amidohydrolase [Breoghania corrubedonensis]
MRVAAAQYPIDWLDSLDDWKTKTTDWVEQALSERAQLLVFPEYGSMELASLFGKEVAGNIDASVDAMGGILPDFIAHWRALAVKSGVHILAPSFPERDAAGMVRNVARLFTPAGACGEQAKIVMTRFEGERWGFVGGGPIRVFETALGRIAIDICYDVEFPAIARAQAEAGAWLILAPSTTEGVMGASRVAIGAAARALENQCYVVTAPTSGKAPWSVAVDVSRGAARVVCPPDIGFAETGLLAVGEMDAAQWVFADVDPALVASARADGDVLIFADRTKPGGSAPKAEIIDLTAG